MDILLIANSASVIDILHSTTRISDIEILAIFIPLDTARPMQRASHKPLEQSECLREIAAILS